MKTTSENKEFNSLTQKELDFAIKKGEEYLKVNGYAKSIKFNEDSRMLIILFSNEKTVSLLVDNYPESKNLTNNDLKSITIGFAGTAICLESHDLHIYIDGLIKNQWFHP